MPNSRTVGRMFASMPRLTIEYSICRAEIECTEFALRIVEAEASESPM